MKKKKVSYERRLSVVNASMPVLVCDLCGNHTDLLNGFTKNDEYVNLCEECTRKVEHERDH